MDSNDLPASAVPRTRRPIFTVAIFTSAISIAWIVLKLLKARNRQSVEEDKGKAMQVI